MVRRFVLGLLLVSLAAHADTPPPCVTRSKPSNLPLPSSFDTNQNPAAFQKILTAFLNDYEYEKKEWCRDKGIRDTGPWINNQYSGTHPAVRIYYSPEVMRWLVDDRKGELPDGAMIIKEQFKPPAARWAGMSDSDIRKQFIANGTDWTVMIRDSKGSQDGWYWTEIWAGQAPDSFAPPFAVRNSGFGLYCFRCHAAAEKELTFSSTVNIEGFGGTPLTYRDDNSWRCESDPLCPGYVAPKTSLKDPEDREALAPNHPGLDPVTHAEKTTPKSPVNEWLAKFFTKTPTNTSGPIPTFPGENYDHVVAHAGKNGPQYFLTSDQCFGCHSASTYGNVMLVTKNNVNVSPYGEWRWSPMALAGRDPVFYAQLESEMQYLDTRNDPKKKAEIVDLCFSCHGVLGERQLGIDSKEKQQFKLPYTQLTDLSNPFFKYGALARDGVSCTSCHHIEGRNETFSQFIHRNITGQFDLNASNQLFGPFKDDEIVQFPMEEALGITPKHDPYIQSSRLCGSCHTIRLPVLDETPVGHSFEQLTYLEWLNSDFEDEFNKKNPKAQSCQNCHMRGTYDGHQIQAQIAFSEDSTYPMSDNRAPAGKIDVRFRKTGFARHQLQGLNVFLLEMFNQFSKPLGVRTCDYMLSGCNQPPISGIPTAVDNFVKQARNDTATLSVGTPRLANGTLTTDVTVTNLTGHRFPSGVSFRRAFIEFVVTDKSGKTLFASGKTNPGGWIVDQNNSILPSEWNGAQGPRGQHHQPHFWTGNPITRSDQVQIYEELLKDAQGNFTTSFIRQDEHFKDNRLLPRGWSRKGPNPKEFNGRALEATYPHGTGKDPKYADGSGASIVRYAVKLPAGITLDDVNVSAKLWFQAIPPYYLNQRFEQVPNGEATRRLYQLVTQLDTSKTVFPEWKLLVAEGQR